jgi:hypothetical protein
MLMSKLKECNTLQEAVDFLKGEGSHCTYLAAYLHAAGVDKQEAQDALTAAGFDEHDICLSLASLYTALQTRVIDRLRSLHVLLEVEQTPGS